MAVPTNCLSQLDVTRPVAKPSCTIRRRLSALGYQCREHERRHHEQQALRLAAQDPNGRPAKPGQVSLCRAASERWGCGDTGRSQGPPHGSLANGLVGGNWGASGDRTIVSMVTKESIHPNGATCRKRPIKAPSGDSGSVGTRRLAGWLVSVWVRTLTLPRSGALQSAQKSGHYRYGESAFGTPLVLPIHP